MDMNILYNACIMLIRTELISEIFLINLYYYSFLQFRFNKLMINFFLNLKFKILEKEIKSRNRQITSKLSL